MTTVLGVQLNHRANTAVEFQQVVSKHGCQIKSRIGLHDVAEGVCSPSGIILLELIGDANQIKEIEADLSAIQDAKIQKMVF